MSAIATQPFAATLWWTGETPPAFSPSALRAATERNREAAHVVPAIRTPDTWASRSAAPCPQPPPPVVAGR